MNKIKEVWKAVCAAQEEYRSLLWDGHHLEIVMSYKCIEQILVEEPYVRWDGIYRDKYNYLFGLPLNICSHVKGGYRVVLAKGAA